METSKTLQTGWLVPERRNMQQEALNHRVISPSTLHSASTFVAVTTDHSISVPVAWSGPQDSKDRIDVVFTIVEKLGNKDRSFWSEIDSLSPEVRARRYVQHAGNLVADDMLLYLQGGPGFGSPTPVVDISLAEDSSWIAKVLSSGKYSRVVLMDQRGCGRSTPVTKQTLEAKFPDLLRSDEEPSKVEEITSASKAKMDEAACRASDYLIQFRADSIVRDAEAIRSVLLSSQRDTSSDESPWGCVLGQSFGGFCILTYLSQVKRPPKICLLTGGIAPILTPVDTLYSSLWNRVKARSLQYYEMFPGDIRLIKTIVKNLIKKPEPLPSGGTLTARRFLQLGISLGGSPGSFASMHAMFNSALIPSDDGFVWNRTFLKRLESIQAFDDYPIYFWLHESIYASDGTSSPTKWSAHRMYEQKAKSHPEFDYMKSAFIDDDTKPVIFFGEMVFPWMSEDYSGLSGHGFRRIAHNLAEKSDWGKLFDEKKIEETLVSGTCRAAAAVYFDDMYVDFDATTAVLSGPMKSAKVWITNEYQHSGLRDDGSTIFEKLHGMATGEIRIPS